MSKILPSDCLLAIESANKPTVWLTLYEAANAFELLPIPVLQAVLYHGGTYNINTLKVSRVSKSFVDIMQRIDS